MVEELFGPAAREGRRQKAENQCERRVLPCPTWIRHGRRRAVAFEGKRCTTKVGGSDIAVPEQLSVPGRWWHAHPLPKARTGKCWKALQAMLAAGKACNSLIGPLYGPINRALSQEQAAAGLSRQIGGGRRPIAAQSRFYDCEISGMVRIR